MKCLCRSRVVMVMPFGFPAFDPETVFQHLKSGERGPGGLDMNNDFVVIENAHFALQFFLGRR